MGVTAPLIQTNEQVEVTCEVRERSSVAVLHQSARSDKTRRLHFASVGIKVYSHPDTFDPNIVPKCNMREALLALISRLSPEVLRINRKEIPHLLIPVHAEVVHIFAVRPVAVQEDAQAHSLPEGSLAVSETEDVPAGVALGSEELEEVGAQLAAVLGQSVHLFIPLYIPKASPFKLISQCSYEHPSLSPMQIREFREFPSTTVAKHVFSHLTTETRLKMTKVLIQN